MLAGSLALRAQTKVGHIDISTLILAMPEFKKADTALALYQQTLNNQYSGMVEDFNSKDAELASKDTIKYTKTQLEMKRRDLAQLYVRIQGWNQQAQQLYDQRQGELLNPIQRKAEQAIQQVAKENGYTYVLNRNALAIEPSDANDLLPLVKKKLGLR